MENTQTECQAVLSRLYAYLDGEIAEGEAGEVDRHLEMCVECARRFGFERELKELVRRKCDEGVSSPGLTDIIRERLRGIAE